MISPDSQGGPNIALITIVCGWTFLGVALLSVSLFIWATRIQKNHLGLDGYLTILGLAITIALVAQTTWAIVYEGQDDHEGEVSSSKFALVVRSLLINQTLWGVVNTLVRTSALLLIKKLFGVRIRRTATVLLVIAMLYGLVVFLETFLICRPMAVDWNAHIDGTCGNQVVSYVVLEVFGLLLDFAILVLPLPVLWALKINLKGKTSLTITLSVGFLVSVVTGLRIQALHMVNAVDFTYSKGYLGLLSELGASLGITFCCTPYIATVYRRYRQAYLQRTNMATFHGRTGGSDRVTFGSSVPADEENCGTNIDTRHETPIPMTEDSTIKTHGRSTRFSVDCCDANSTPPPYHGLRRNHTF